MSLRTFIFGYKYKYQRKGDFYNGKHNFQRQDKIGLRNKSKASH